MLNQIKALLQDGQLRQKIKAAKTLDEAIKLIMTTAAEKGNNFRTEDVTQMLSKLAPGSENELSESDLLAIAGVIAATAPAPTNYSVCFCSAGLF